MSWEPECDGGRVPEEQEEGRPRQDPPLQGPLSMQLQTLLGARIVKREGNFLYFSVM